MYQVMLHMLISFMMWPVGHKDVSYETGSLNMLLQLSNNGEC